MKNPTCKCEDCGKEAEFVFEPSFQEYAGACVQPSSSYFECECGWYKDANEAPTFIDGRENTRGW